MSGLSLRASPDLRLPAYTGGRMHPSARPDGGWFTRVPRPIRRFVAKVPAALYKAGLGWLFGHRFLLLTHRGRRSGRLYHTMIEIILYDPGSGEATVVSAAGAGADWYRNIQASPPVEVHIGRERYMPDVRLLDAEESREGMRKLARQRPLEARIASWLGMDDKPLVVFGPANRK